NNVDAADNIGELYSTIYALTAAIDAKDHYTFNHSQCVSKYAVHLAELAGLPADHVEIIRQAGLLHDIGKIGIPDAILSKEDRLTDDEFNIMRQHVERSIEMIRHLPSLDYVIPVVIGHHERYDGKGYPRGIKGEYIPVGARVLAIADAFDAMVSRRAYKTKMPVDKALEEIERNAGTQFDARLAMLFIEGVQTGAIQVIDY
ncbi:MAG: HD-GYP domain-containing protein, partial [Parasporobacterium sp.]|nr:HD-GYP domain-containing protein [Parasporobacterium sp.]